MPFQTCRLTREYPIPLEGISGLVCQVVEENSNLLLLSRDFSLENEITDEAQNGIEMVHHRYTEL